MSATIEVNLRGEISLHLCSPVLSFSCVLSHQSVLVFSSSEMMVIKFWRPKM